MTSGPRERLLSSAITLVRRHGVAGTGLNELLDHSRTARGSIYQHFPRGKDELIESSTRLAADAMGFARSGKVRTPAQVVAVVVGASRQGLVDGDYELGCPVAAAATAGPEHDGVVSAAGDVFTSWNADLAGAFVRGGMTPATARSFASLVVSAVEGALVQARATRSTQPFDDVAKQLTVLAKAHVRG